MDLKFPLGRLKTLTSSASVMPQRLLVATLIFACMIASSSAQVTVDFECVYSNSSDSYCHNLCPLGCFYSLVPKPCSPEGQVSQIIIINHYTLQMHSLHCTGNNYYDYAQVVFASVHPLSTYSSDVTFLH